MRIHAYTYAVGTYMDTCIHCTPVNVGGNNFHAI